MSYDAGSSESTQAAQLTRLGAGELTIASEREGDTYVIALTGELDLATADAFERVLLRAEATDARSIVVDLSGLSFMDSTGIRLMLSADARSRADGHRLTLLRGPAAVQRVFELTATTDLLPFAVEP
jgi:anti-sigma B factor antagonist